MSHPANPQQRVEFEPLVHNRSQYATTLRQQDPNSHEVQPACEARDEPRDLAPAETSWPNWPDVDESADRAMYSRPRRFGPGDAVATDGGRCER